MRKRLRIVLAIVGVAILGWLGWKALRTPEPSYQGRRLSEWLDGYNHAGGMDKTESVSEAIRAMGTNSLPFLLANIKHTYSPLEQTFFKLVRKQHLVKLPFYGKDPYRTTSILALSALGSKAAPLCPELLEVSENPRYSMWGQCALLAIGPAAIPTLATVCQNTNEDVRTGAVLMMAMLKSEPSRRFGGGWSKAPVNGRPMFEIMYPVGGDDQIRAMIKLLEAPEAAVRRASADAIGQYTKPPYDQVAKSAVEPLIKAVNDEDAEVRLSAGRTLKVMDPMAAAKAGVK
jgi:HEAT repeat protein